MPEPTGQGREPDSDDSSSPAKKTLGESLQELDALQLFAASLAIIPALGYLIGFVAVNRAASRLGLAVSDFGFGFRDFLLLPGMFYVGIAVAFLLWEAQDRWNGKVWAKYDTRWKNGIGTSVGWIVGSLIASSYTVLIVLLVGDNGWSAGVLLIAAVACIYAVTHFAPENRVVSNLLAVAVVALAASALTVISSVRWADDLVVYSENGKATPSAMLSPGYVLNPQTGRLCIDGKCRCRVRVSSNVIGSPDGFQVVPDIESFTPSRCEPQT